jgi:molybdenum cofactor synthesis domain-containing protein
MGDLTCAIAVIGDEILSGKYVDENARFAIDELRAAGVRLRRIEVIPDDVDDIAATVARLSARFDQVLTSGGVGPTHDDLTMAGIARGFGVGLTLHPRLVELCVGYFGAALTEPQQRLAQVPEGAELVDAPDLTVPVVRVRNVYVLPGVPSLFRQKLVALRPLLRGRPFVVGRVHLAVDETVVADRLAAIARAFPTVAIGSYPRFDDAAYALILTLEGRERDDVARVLAALAEALGDLVLRVDPPA